MEKVDLKKQLKSIYSASAKKISQVRVPAMNFLMVDGQGDPNTAKEYQDAIEALFSVSYTAKFMIKRGPTAMDYVVMPLEGLWWTDDMTEFSVDNKEIWKWTAMIMQPEWVTHSIVEEAKEQAGKKKELPKLDSLRFEAFSEGEAVQVMHIGPYAEEAPTIERLHNYIADRGLALRDKHHEIYLSDPRRANPARLRTIIRQPVQ